jgi:hypothetical protein
MAKKGFFVGMLAKVTVVTLALVFGMALAGCKGDDDGGLSLNLSAIDEEVSGRTEAIEYSNISLTRSVLSEITDAATAELNIGSSSSKKTIGGDGEWFVTNGKLTLSLPAVPSNTIALSTAALDLRAIFFDISDSNELSFTVNNANFVLVYELRDSQDQSHNYLIDRSVIKRDGVTYGIMCTICYLYVDKAVTITRSAKSIMEQEDYAIAYSSINLQLKAGWNLVQLDDYRTLSGGTRTVKLADKDVPWSVNAWSNS